MTYQNAFAALADPTRREIFEIIASETLSVGALSERVPVSRPAVSQHLKVLSDAELILADKQGARNIYRVNREGLASLRGYLDGLWDDVLGAFADEIGKQIEE